jgi:REP element-mobilizing transposase RayT
MPRKARRLQWTEAACYHVTGRGHNRKTLFSDDADRGKFLELLGRYRRRFEWRLFAYCLMSNHYHLLIQMRDPRDLSVMMAGLQLAYVHYYHRRRGFVGHLWQGRFWSPAIEMESLSAQLRPLHRTQPARSEDGGTAVGISVVELPPPCSRGGEPVAGGEPLLPGDGRDPGPAAAALAGISAGRRSEGSGNCSPGRDSRRGGFSGGDRDAAQPGNGAWARSAAENGGGGGNFFVRLWWLSSSVQCHHFSQCHHFLTIFSCSVTIFSWW